MKVRKLFGAGTSARFLRQSGIYGAGRAVSQLTGVVLLPIYLAALTPAEFGVLAVAQMLPPVMIAVWTLGLEPAVGRFYYEYEGAERDRIVSTTFKLVRLISSAGLVATILIGPVLFPLIVKNAPFFPHIFVVSWTAYFQSFAVLPLLVMRMREQAHLYTIATSGSLLLTIAANVYFLLVLDYGVLGILLGNLVGSAISAIAYVWYLKRYLSRGFEWEFARRSFRYSLPMLPELIFGNLVQTADRFILDKVASPANIGLFSVARQFGVLIHQAVLSLKTAYTPLGLKVWLQEAQPQLQLSRMTLWFVAIGSTIAACVIMFARELMLTIGRAEYEAAIPMIPLACLSSIVLLEYYVLTMAPLLRDRVRSLLTVFGIYAVSLVGLNVLLILRFGVWGALIANSAALLVRSVAVYFVGEFRHPVGLPLKAMIAIALPVAVMVPIAMMRWNVLPLHWAILLKLVLLVLYSWVVFLFVARRDRAVSPLVLESQPTS